MEIPHGASVVVTDGSKALFLHNEGDTLFSNLQLVQKWERPSDADHTLKADGPGRTHSSHDGGSRRSAYSETNLHQSAEDRFMSEVARELRRKVSKGNLRQLVIVAPPRALGELRKHLDRDVAAVVAAEVAKDLVKHPIPEIEHLLAQYGERDLAT